MRIAHGLPVVYPTIRTEEVTSSVWTVVWSPCSKFIAVAWYKMWTTIEILDAATFERLTILKHRLGQTRRLIFSPDSRSLTWFGGNPEEFISWDLRTGTQLSAIPLEPECSIGEFSSLTYSECGTMVGVLCFNAENSTISTYNVLSGTHICSHRVGRVLGKVWTHGECIRYATFVSGSITIWEFGFASRHEPTQVESLSTPDNFHPPEGLLIHPSLSRLAFIDRRAVLVWDCRESRFLLDSKDVENLKEMSFSLDGRLFACETIGQEIYLWKESPAGYGLYRKLKPSYGFHQIRVSPDGGSIVGWGDSGVQVWRTTNPVTSLSGISTQTPSRARVHMVEFSPGEVFAAITQLQDNVVTVLDLESGDPWLVIDTGVEVHGLRVGRSVIVVVGEGKIITWDLPAGNLDRAYNARANIDDSVRTTTFVQPPSSHFSRSYPISISLDLHRMAIMGEAGGMPTGFNLHLYDVSTGQRLACVSTDPNQHVYDGSAGRSLASVSMRWRRTPWFALGGHEVWCIASGDKAEGWTIIEDSESDAIRLEGIGLTADPPGGFPWKPHGYVATDDGWVLSPSGKRILWLPRSRSSTTDKTWNGRFLALLHPVLQEPVLLELPAE
jgi:WD40 repeat protein